MPNNNGRPRGNAGKMLGKKEINSLTTYFTIVALTKPEVTTVEMITLSFIHYSLINFLDL